MNTTDPDRMASLVYNALVRVSSRCHRRGGIALRLWQKAWDRSCASFRRPVRTTIHGREVVLNFGNTYPIYTRLSPDLNCPLVELIFQAHAAKGSPISYVDVGAATGDSILLLHANCPDMIAKTYCVDGDREFFGYLQKNVAHIPGVKLRFTLLSSTSASINELVRTHTGTASAQGTAVAEAVTLDTIIREDGVGPVDVLKIDVDGFDGQILLGAGELLDRDRPAVIFEWHPILCEQTKNNWTDHFEALSAAGYDRFVWFTKLGRFSHFTCGYEPDSVALLAKLCLVSKMYPDWHYDVVALHAESTVSPMGLADLSFAQSRRSRH